MTAPRPAVALPAPAARLSASLLAWYRSRKRPLPWRGARDPYAIWISEVMLQQTQSSVVLPYYDRFLAAYPTVQALARARLPAVLALWSGLGYYARARHLHAAAKVLALRGEFPRTLEELRQLPGFGPYTAAAVASIAFGLPEPAIDGNAVRVYARLAGLSAPRAKAEPLLREAARPLLEAGPPGDLNQAIMDLGQAICLPRAPHCLLCPWRAPCVARAAGTTAELPLRAKPPVRRALAMVAARLVRRGGLLLARRRERGLFAGLWELPGGEVTQAGPAALAALLEAELGLRATIQEELASVSQVLTHRDLTVTAYASRATGRPRPTSGGHYLEARFVPLRQVADLAMSSVTAKLLDALGLGRTRR